MTSLIMAKRISLHDNVSAFKATSKVLFVGRMTLGTDLMLMSSHTRLELETNFHRWEVKVSVPPPPFPRPIRRLQNWEYTSILWRFIPPPPQIISSPALSPPELKMLSSQPGPDSTWQMLENQLSWPVEKVKVRSVAGEGNLSPRGKIIAAQFGLINTWFTPPMR